MPGGRISSGFLHTPVHAGGLVMCSRAAGPAPVASRGMEFRTEAEPTGSTDHGPAI
jgi:hypothetical protein